MIFNILYLFRIVLKQGTPSIQKLWCAAILTNSSCIQSEVRYLRFFNLLITSLNHLSFLSSYEKALSSFAYKKE